MKMNPEKKTDEEIQRFIMQVQTMRERLKGHEKDCQRDFERQMDTLEELLRWCDYMLYQLSTLSPKKDPEGR